MLLNRVNASKAQREKVDKEIDLCIKDQILF